ncbi:MAG: hypothetical protein R3A45_11620 [Bdellovibrionota bacterium]
MFVGIVCWKWFASTVQAGASSIFSNRGLYKKNISFKIIFHGLKQFITIKFLVILFFYFLSICDFRFSAFKKPPLPAYFNIVSVCTGIGSCDLFLASIFAIFCRLKIFVALGLRLAFYPSGVLFNLKRVPERYQYIVDYNPIAQGIQGFRDIIMNGQHPSHFGLFWMFCVGLFFYICGSIIVKVLDRRYAKIGV